MPAPDPARGHQATARRPFPAPGRALSWRCALRARPGPREGLSPPQQHSFFNASVVFSAPQMRTMRRWRGDDMPSDQLPPRPSLDQLRRRAKELRDAARSGDPAALARITAYAPAARSGTVPLAAAQLAIAREHGYPSWPQLAAEVQARTAERAQRVEEFLVASIRDWTGRAARMLARDPWMADYDIRTAVILGDAARVGDMLAREPGLATRTDEKT